ncbi:hypothetical protein L0U85_03770 [Glycomyces sp. L485]|uniref:hypothetical protein n=1 Tax=Glycomyces sp. L485 TaxID=2909235 RepID=UPI001F4B753F|nr:hypothetical protein [Glycomyces sp. L485]MCH7229980.1 hypothetical protein [Glycomyces sp. L485]
MATAFRLTSAAPCIRSNFIERDWLVPNHDYLIAEARYFMEYRMLRQLVCCGEFDLDGCIVRAYRERYSKAPRLRFRCVKPAPEFGLGYADNLGTDQPRFHPFNSGWSDELLADAARLAARVWAELDTGH